MRALHVPRGQLWRGDTQTGNTLSTAEQCVGVSWPHVGWDGVVLGTVMGLGAQCRYVSTVNVTGASSPSGDGEESACSDGVLLAHVCICGGTNSCRASMCGAAPCSRLGVQSCPASPSRASWMLHAPQLYLSPWGVLCLGNAGDQGSIRLRHYLSGEKDHHAAAASQGQTDTGVVGKGTSVCPRAAGTHGWCWPWGHARQGKRLLHVSGQCSTCSCVLGLGSASPGPGIRADRPRADGPQGDEHQVDEQNSRTAMT